MDWETYQRQCIGVSDRTMIERLAAHHTPPLDFETLWAIYPSKRDALRERLMTDPQVFLPATLDLVRALAKHLPLAVVSSSARNEVEPPLVNVGVGDCFETMVCGHESPRLKPAPHPYLRAAEILGIKRALVVEDSEAGETSGRAAGFDVLRISHPGEVAGKVMERLSLSSTL